MDEATKNALMRELPGIIEALRDALNDATGQRMTFSLFVWDDNRFIFASNGEPDGLTEALRSAATTIDHLDEDLRPEQPPRLKN